MPIQIKICPMATPRTTAGPETSKKAFMREPKTLENKIKKEKEQMENEVKRRAYTEIAKHFDQTFLKFDDTACLSGV